MRNRVVLLERPRGDPPFEFCKVPESVLMKEPDVAGENRISQLQWLSSKI
jgi:hypothetical protein